MEPWPCWATFGLMAPPDPLRHARGIDALLDLMATLRGPDGCPWDRQQSLETLLPYAIEEVYEVVEAVEGGDPARHRDELGDLLLQVVFQARIREEQGHFDFDDVARGITEKLVRRHPHVFGDGHAEDASAVRMQWERIKAKERGADVRSLEEAMPKGMPSLLAATRVGEKAARDGLDWPDATAVLGKVDEEFDELCGANADGDTERIEEELGDMLFALTSFARHRGIDPERALRGSLRRFARRHRRLVEIARSAGVEPAAAMADQIDDWWSQAKSEERA